MAELKSHVGEPFLRELLSAGLLVDCGVPGLYGRSDVFEDIIEAIDDYASRLGQTESATRRRFPPLLNRAVFDKSGYMKNMPQLAGIVHSFAGSAQEHTELIKDIEQGKDIGPRLSATDIVLTPAACYPLYPTLKGKLPQGGRSFDIQSYCFRHEPSLDPARMQAFRMREYVRLGEAGEVQSFRTRWLERGQQMFEELGLDAHVALANDPFFGRTGRMLAANQRDQELKYELVVPITSADEPTAVMSFNYHQDLFGRLYEIEANGEPAHTSCVGFGLERIAIALLKKHGFAPKNWPKNVHERLFQ